MSTRYWTALGTMTLGFCMAGFFGQAIVYEVGGLWDWTLPGYTLGVIFASVGAAGQRFARLDRSVESLSARVAELENAAASTKGR